MCLSNFKAIRQLKVPISWLWDFTRSYEKTSFRILRRGPGILCQREAVWIAAENILNLYYSTGFWKLFSYPSWAPSQYPKRRLSVRSRKISKPRDLYLDCPIALKFDRHFSSSAADVPVKFQSDTTIESTNLVASRLYEILRKDVFSDIETGPWHSVSEGSSVNSS